MDIRRKVFIGLALLCVFGGTVALAAPMPCQIGTLADYTVPNFACTEGGGVFTIKGFAYIGSLAAGSIVVVPNNNTGQMGFLFQGAFAVSQGQKAVFQISYFEDPPPIIHEEQIDLDPFAAVVLQTVLCLSSTVPCPNANTITTLTAMTGNTTAATGLNNLNVLGVQNTLTLDGTQGAATSGGFDNITFLAPEPAAILLTASGLLGLFAVRFRLKLRQVLREFRS